MLKMSDCFVDRHQIVTDKIRKLAAEESEKSYKGDFYRSQELLAKLGIKETRSGVLKELVEYSDKFLLEAQVDDMINLFNLAKKEDNQDALTVITNTIIKCDYEGAETYFRALCPLLMADIMNHTTLLVLAAISGRLTSAAKFICVQIFNSDITLDTFFNNFPIEIALLISSLVKKLSGERGYEGCIREGLVFILSRAANNSEEYLSQCAAGCLNIDKDLFIELVDGYDMIRLVLNPEFSLYNPGVCMVFLKFLARYARLDPECSKDIIRKGGFGFGFSILERRVSCELEERSLLLIGILAQGDITAYLSNNYDLELFNFFDSMSYSGKCIAVRLSVKLVNTNPLALESRTIVDLLFTFPVEEVLSQQLRAISTVFEKNPSEELRVRISDFIESQIDTLNDPELMDELTEFYEYCRGRA